MSRLTELSILTSSRNRSDPRRGWYRSWPQTTRPAGFSRCVKFRRYAVSAPLCCTATWCNRLGKSRRIFRSSMPPVLLRTNFTDRKARDFFFYEAAYQSNPLCLVARTRTSDAPEQRTSPRSREWLRPQNGYYEIVRENRSAKGNCVTNCGGGSPKAFRRQNRMGQARRGWQT